LIAKDELAASDLPECTPPGPPLDIVGDTSTVTEAGPKVYHISPDWVDKRYEIAVSSPVVDLPILRVAFVMVCNYLNWTRSIIAKLQDLGLRVVLIDQNSTYPPLLEFYKHSDLEIKYLTEHVSRYNFVSSGIIDECCGADELYAVVDCDLNIDNLTRAALDQLVDTVVARGVAAGLSNDPPELPLWEGPASGPVFPFTVYRVGSRVNGIPQACVQADIKHMPDVIDVAAGLDEEMLFYARAKLAALKCVSPAVLDRYLRVVDKPRDDSQ